MKAVQEETLYILRQPVKECIPGRSYVPSSPTARFGSLAGASSQHCCVVQFLFLLRSRWKTELKLQGPPSQNAAGGCIRLQHAEAKHSHNNTGKKKRLTRCMDSIERSYLRLARILQLNSQLVVCNMNFKTNLCTGLQFRLSATDREVRPHTLCWPAPSPPQSGFFPSPFLQGSKQ